MCVSTERPAEESTRVLGDAVAAFAAATAPGPASDLPDAVPGPASDRPDAVAPAVNWEWLSVAAVGDIDI